MENIMQSIVNKNLTFLVDFVLSKNPNANRGQINHKINELGLFKSKPQNSKTVINSLMVNKPVLTVVKTETGNYILQGNNNPIFKDLKKNKFVLNLTTKKVIGIENLNGEIEPLNKSLIEICHKYKLKYEIPLNLNTSNDPEEDDIIINEMQELKLNYAESEEECED
ncbi:hypothetical protein IIV22A_014R [Invertebrate iridescent virus 22]|uniref:Uncharacterized protein n=1 Tax=Invertebrate iridescent virus 22 TaxID=345198 RepID=W8W199_9VIRU|nr:hypothetical protein IIV22A_014R [Invertebrate iridescent virus 22]CCV01858.1 hypothetical protein IIV22A_014R [Invertebrate iridescent virus 22]